MKIDEKSPRDLLLIQADNAFVMNNHQQAALYYAQVLKQNNDDEELHLRYIESLLSSPEKNLTLIIEAFKKYLSTENGINALNLKDIQQMRSLGMLQDVFDRIEQTKNPLLTAVSLIDDDLKQAHIQLDLIPIDLRDTNFYVVSAEIHFLLNDYDRVVSDTDSLLNEGYAEPKVYYYRAQAFARNGQIEESQLFVDLYQQLMVITSGSAAQQVDAIRQLIKSYPIFKKNTTVTMLYINALQRSDQESEALNELALVGDENISVKARIAMAKTAIQFNQSAIMTWLNNQSMVAEKNLDNKMGHIILDGLLCEYFVNTKQISLAQHVCDTKISDSHHHAPMYYWSGEWLLQNQDFEQAIQLKKLALLYAPWAKQWRMQLAHIYLSQGHIDLARSLFDQKMMQTDPVIKRFVFENGLKIDD